MRKHNQTLTIKSLREFQGKPETLGTLRQVADMNIVLKQISPNTVYSLLMGFIFFLAINSAAAQFEIIDVPLDSAGTVKMKMIRIPRGTFKMGSTAETDELPIRNVTITKDFYMGVYEVTQGEWKALMGTTIEQVLAKNKQADYWIMRGKGDNVAMYLVTHQDCEDFCEKLGQKMGTVGRLPTEAEWEYTYRAGTQTTWPWGNSGNRGDYGWFFGNARKIHPDSCRPVGQKLPNPWGLYDMSGNAGEYVHDYYGYNYYSSGDTIDPMGPIYGLPNPTVHSFRPGRWYSYDSFRSAERHDDRQNDTKGWGIGFRAFFQADSNEALTPYVGIKKSGLSGENSKIGLNNFPNPFTSSTSISYKLDKNVLVQLSVYDVSGKLAKILTNGFQKPGDYNVTWESINANTGIYLLRLKAGKRIYTRKIMIVK